MGLKQIDQEYRDKDIWCLVTCISPEISALFARREYGKGSITTRFSKINQLRKFESLVWGTPGTDWGSGIIRDGLTSPLYGIWDVRSSGIQPAVVYIEREYWGILDIREKVNFKFSGRKPFCNPDEVNLLEFGNNIMKVRMSRIYDNH